MTIAADSLRTGVSVWMSGSASWMKTGVAWKMTNGG